MKLRLFALRDTKTNKIIPDAFFPNKPSAKKARDQLNEAGGAVAVTPGPDHRRYVG